MRRPHLHSRNPNPLFSKDLATLLNHYKLVHVKNAYEDDDDSQDRIPLLKILKGEGAPTQESLFQAGTTESLADVSLSKIIQNASSQEEGMAQCIAACLERTSLQVKALSEQLLSEEHILLTQIQKLINRAIADKDNKKTIFIAACGASGRIALIVNSILKLYKDRGLLNEDNMPEVKVALAGGDSAFVSASPGCEDNAFTALLQLRAQGFKPGDLVIGVSASGGAQFAWAAALFAALQDDINPKSDEISALMLTCNDLDLVEKKYNVLADNIKSGKLNLPSNYYLQTQADKAAKAAKEAAHKAEPDKDTEDAAHKAEPAKDAEDAAQQAESSTVPLEIQKKTAWIQDMFQGMQKHLDDLKKRVGIIGLSDILPTLVSGSTRMGPATMQYLKLLAILQCAAKEGAFNLKQCCDEVAAVLNAYKDAIGQVMAKIAVYMAEAIKKNQPLLIRVNIDECPWLAKLIFQDITELTPTFNIPGENGLPSIKVQFVSNKAQEDNPCSDSESIWKEVLLPGVSEPVDVDPFGRPAEKKRTAYDFSAAGVEQWKRAWKAKQQASYASAHGGGGDAPLEVKTLDISFVDNTFSIIPDEDESQASRICFCTSAEAAKAEKAKQDAAKAAAESEVAQDAAAEDSDAANESAAKSIPDVVNISVDKLSPALFAVLIKEFQNASSTSMAAGCGYVWDSVMTNLRGDNKKLVDRALRNVLLLMAHGPAHQKLPKEHWQYIDRDFLYKQLLIVMHMQLEKQLPAESGVVGLVVKQCHMACAELHKQAQATAEAAAEKAGSPAPAPAP